MAVTPLSTGDPVCGQAVVAEPARVSATVNAGPAQDLRVGEAQDLQLSGTAGRHGPQAGADWAAGLEALEMASPDAMRPTMLRA